MGTINPNSRSDETVYEPLAQDDIPGEDMTLADDGAPDEPHFADGQHSVGDDGAPEADEQIFLAAAPRRCLGKYRCEGHKLVCYTPKQMRYLYGGEEVSIVGEMAANVYSDRERAGRVRIRSGAEFDYYAPGSFSRPRYWPAGYMPSKTSPDRFILLQRDCLIYLLLLGSGLLIALSLLILLILSPGSEPASTPHADPNSVNWAGVSNADTGGVAEGIRIPGYKSITIAANTTDVAVNFFNPSQNQCYFVINLVLTDTNETIYRSGLCLPGQGYYNINLTRALSPGAYNAAVVYETYSLEDGVTPLNGAKINIQLIAS